VAAALSTEVSYVAQHEALAAVLVPEVARRLGLETVEADLVYCSRSGPPQARWLEPDVNDHLEALAAGHLTDGRLVDRPGGVVGAGHRGVAAGGSRVSQRKALQAGAEGG